MIYYHNVDFSDGVKCYYYLVGVMAAVEKSKVTVKIGENRLYITFAGRITKKVLNDLYTDIRFSIADLTPGFDVISDYRDAQVFILEGIPTFKKMMHYMASSGFGNLVRILDKERLSKTQLANLVQRIHGYRPIIVSSLEEAEEKLVKCKKRNGVRIHLFHVPVEYYLGEQKGDGDINNISLSGCAIESARLMPKVDDEVKLALSFPEKEGMSAVMKINSRVVRIDGESKFVVQFLDISDTQKDELWKILLAKLLDDMV